MKITLHPFALNHSLLYSLLVKRALRRGAWYPIIILIIVIVFYVQGDPTSAITFLTIIPLFFVFLFAYIYYYVYSKKNRNFFQTRQVDIDENFIYTHGNSGSEGKLPYPNIINVTVTPEYYLLFISKIQFYYIPFSAFKTPEDKQQFHNLLLEKKLITKK